ncbi:MAG TPA: ArsR family transcriptional regulator [Ktedonobacteraceae bacterium]|nr:ArsR family transcriptional regulator [Ktedonobacteraceae bacterium]
MENALLQPPEVLKLAGHAVRWNVLTALARSDYRVQDLVEQLALPQNLVSYHLRQLREGHLVTERRSAADERAVFYHLDLERLQALYLAAGEMLHPAVTAEVTALQDLPSNQAPLRVLFLCTENSARSQMAEALLRHLSHGTVEAFSAGSQPAEELHPLARRCMERLGIDMSGAVPKHFEVFRGQRFDAIVTVCDRVLETCPTFPDDPERIHWSFLDPATVQGSEAEQLRAFEQISLQMATRIRFLLTLLQRKNSPREP